MTVVLTKNMHVSTYASQLANYNNIYELGFACYNLPCFTRTLGRQPRTLVFRTTSLTFLINFHLLFIKEKFQLYPGQNSLTILCDISCLPAWEFSI